MLQVAKQQTDWPIVIEQARQLDPEAFDMLVDEYAPRVRGYLRRIIRTDDVDDFVQEVFLRVVRTIGSYHDGGRFDAWIFQIARNLTFDHLREKMRHPIQLDEPVDLETATQNSSRALVPQAGLERAEANSQIEAALSRLPDTEREVILLRHFGRLTFEEIATVMNTPLGTALARSHRGLSKLRNSMENRHEN
jgi:RNA polymerase sigma-70 factor, ECF subfamily